MRAPGRRLAAGPAERVAGGPRGRLSRGGGTRRGHTAPLPPPSQPLTSCALCFSLSFCSWGSGTWGKSHKLKRLECGQHLGSFPVPPASHRGCRRSDGDDLPGPGLHQGSNHGGGPGCLWGDRGVHMPVSEAGWEGVAVGREDWLCSASTGLRPVVTSLLTLPLHQPPLSPTAHLDTLCLFFTSFTLK